MASRTSSTPSERRKRSRRVHERSRIALLDVFRTAFEEKDARHRNESYVEGSGTTVAKVNARSKARRIGVDEATLRAHVRDHLATLMNTVRLDAAISLDETPLVAASVVNYGFQDLSNLSRNELRSFEIARSIKQSLIDHEPRLVPASVQVQVKTLTGDTHARVSVEVTADLIADPADIPVEFQAEVDMGAGKVTLNSARI